MVREFDETNPDDWRDVTGYELLDWRRIYESKKDRDEAWDRFIRLIRAQAWDEGHRACDRDWEFTADLSTPDEERQPWTNPYMDDDE